MFSLRDIALTAFILGLLPFVLKRPHWGILLWTWIGLMNPHRMTWGFAYSFPFAFIVAIVTLFAIVISKERMPMQWRAPMVMLALLIAWFGVTTALFALYPQYAWPKLEKVLKIQLFIFLTLMVMQSEERIKALVTVATLSIAFFGIKGGVYTILKGGGGKVLGPDGGFIAGNTEIALALVVTLPLMRWLQLQTTNRKLRIVAGVAMFLIGVSILGSYSRGGFLALAAVAGILIWKSRKRFLLAPMVVAAAVGLLAFMPQEWHERIDTIENYQQDRSAMSRLDAWTFAWNMTKDRPIGGGGFEAFQREAYDIWMPEARPFDAHSIWFQILGEHGYVGLALYVLFWVTAWRTGSKVMRLCRSHPELLWAKDLAGMIQTAMVGFWVGGSFLGLAYWDYPYILVAALVATLVVVEQRVKRAVERRPAPRVERAQDDQPAPSGQPG